VDLQGNPLITPLPVVDQKDVVGGDIRDIPRILAAIEKDWADASSLNRQTARNLFRRLFEAALYKDLRHRIGKRFDDQPEIDARVWAKAAEFAGRFDGSSNER